MKILDAVQECSGLVVRTDCLWPVGASPGEESPWVRPPVPGLSVEEAERLIEEQGVRVVGRL